MRNAEQWQPTKFVRTKRGLRASRNPKYVAIESRVIADVIAASYERAVQTYSSGHLLDLGCGYVPLYATYCNLVKDSVCADWNNTLHKNDYLDAIVDLNRKLPFRDEVFDTVLLTDVLEHIAEPAELIHEIARLLRPGGKLIAGVPFFYWLHEEPHDYYRYTRYALTRFCMTSNFDIVELYPYGGLTEILADLVCKSIGILPNAFSGLSRPLQFLGSAVSRSPIGRKISRNSSEQFPLGYILVAQKNEPPESGAGRGS